MSTSTPFSRKNGTPPAAERRFTGTMPAGRLAVRSRAGRFCLCVDSDRGERPVTLRPGVHNVMATPFLPDETLDVDSIHSLVGYCVNAGCEGVLILGVLGEADRLSDAERETVIRAAVDAARGQLQVTVGITHQSTVVTRQRALEAVEAGATAVMVSPPIGSAAGPALHDHFARIAENLPIPVVVQDHPTSSGVNMP